jgi:hypothetical protein
MNPTKPAAWRSFCPQFNRGLTFRLVLNLGKGQLAVPEPWPRHTASCDGARLVKGEKSNAKRIFNAKR